MSKLELIDYNTITRDDLIRHCKAYSDGMHELGGECQKMMMTITALRAKLQEHGISDPTGEKFTRVPILCEGLGDIV